MVTQQQLKRPKLRTDDAADYIGCSPQTLRNKRHIGGGPPYFKIGTIVTYDPDEIDAWLAEHRRLSTSQPAPQAA